MQLFLDTLSPPASFLYCDVTVITSSLHHTLLHQTTLNIPVVGRTDVLREHTCTVTSCLSVLSVDSVSRSAALDASICHSDWTMEAKHKGVSPHRRANDLSGRGLLITTTTSCFFYFCWTVGVIVWKLEPSWQAFCKSTNQHALTKCLCFMVKISFTVRKTKEHECPL